jgi:hypothetical protein
VNVLASACARRQHAVLAVAVAVVFAGNPPAAHAQMVRDHDAVGLRSFHGIASRIRRSFQSDNQARAVLRQVLAAAGLAGMEDRIVIRASAQTANAEAAIEKNERLIFYNAEFMQEISVRTGNYWSMVAILAHEVGHHVRFHTMLPGREHEFELEADYQAGFILARMGARLEEAQAAFRTFPVEASRTHPARADRVQAVTLGWTDGASGAGPPTTGGPSTSPVMLKQAPPSRDQGPQSVEYAVNQPCSNAESLLIKKLRYEPSRTVVTVTLPGGRNMFVDAPGTADAVYFAAEDGSERLTLVDLRGPFTPGQWFSRERAFDATFVFGPSKLRPTRFIFAMGGGGFFQLKLNCRGLVGK